ncbi:MAG: PASTA domain-containing protein [Myxococcota bacterium]
MSTDKPPLPRGRLATILGLGVSVAALSGLIQLQNVWAHAEPAGDTVELEADETAVAPSGDERVAQAAPPESTPVVVATIANPVPQVDDTGVEAHEPTPADARPPEGPPRITVPDLTGTKIDVAVKTLRGLGLRVSIRDEYGDRVYVEEWQAYKVREQQIEPGTEVEPGSRVRLNAKYRPRFAKGY